MEKVAIKVVGIESRRACSLDVVFLIAEPFNNFVLDILIRVEPGAPQPLRREWRYLDILDELPHRLTLNLHLTLDSAVRQDWH